MRFLSCQSFRSCTSIQYKDQNMHLASVSLILVSCGRDSMKTPRNRTWACYVASTLIAGSTVVIYEIICTFSEWTGSPTLTLHQKLFVTTIGLSYYSLYSCWLPKVRTYCRTSWCFMIRHYQSRLRTLFIPFVPKTDN